MRPLDARGTKRTCLACGVRFYDLARTDISCPSCSATFVPLPPVDPASRMTAQGKPAWPRSRTAARAPIAAVAPDAAEAEDVEEVEDAEEAEVADVGDDVLIEADLTDTDDDVPVPQQDDDSR